MTAITDASRSANKLLVTNGTTEEIKTIASAVEGLNERMDSSMEERRQELVESVREITARLDEMESHIHRLWRSQS